MACSLFTKLNNTFGEQENYGELQVKSLKMADELSSKLFKSLTNPEPDGLKKSGRQVAVIGGGLAGLSAAYYLLREGAQVTLFEPAPDCGGRVRTDKDFIPGRIIEAGAELIGLNHPLWITLARDLGLNLTTVTPELHYLGAQVDLYVDVEEPLEQIDHINQKINLRTETLRRLHSHMDSIYAMLNGHIIELDAYRPWTGRESRKWDGMSVAQWLEGLTLENVSEEEMLLAKRAVAQHLENDQCAPLETQSMLGLLAAVAGGALTQLETTNPSEYWTQSEVFRCGDGNQALVEKLQAACEEHNRAFALKRFRVTQVKRVADLHQVFWDDDSDTFDWVVFAVSSTQLFDTKNESRILFTGNTPPRPPQCGKASKLLTHVNSRFWLRSRHNTCAPSAFSGTLGSFWEATDNQTGPRQTDNEDAGVGVSLFSGSTFANNVEEYVASGNIINQIDSIFDEFERFLSGEGYKYINWQEEEFIGTGYSCPDLGELTTNGDFYCKHHDHVVFAGEYTVPPFFGYMEGALQSGLRAAMIITGSEISSLQTLI